MGQGWLKSKRIQDDIQKAVVSYNGGDFTEAEQILTPLKNKSGNYNSTVDLLLIKTSVMLKKDDQMMKLGREFLRDYPQSRYLDEVYLSYGDMFIHKGQYTTAFRMYLDSRKHAVSDSLISKLDERLQKTLSYSIDHQLINERLSLEHDEIIVTILKLARSFNLLESGKHSECADELAEIEPASVPDAYFDLYERLILTSFKPVAAVRKVGVILPLSGKNMALGQAFLTGFQKGINESQNETAVSLIIHDNQSKDVETIRGIQALESNQDVLAAIGPLTHENSLLASTVLMDSQLPLIIPFSTQDELTELSPSVFQINSTLETRGRYAARTALLEFGLDSIAVLAPSIGEGYQLANAFIEELKALGTALVHVEWYSEIPENLSRQFKSIRKKAWAMIPKDKETDAFLGMEIDSLDALFDVTGEDFFDLPEEEVKVMTSRDSSKVALGTIHGIYIPIVPEHLRYIATQFPMYNLSATVIGNEAWQNLDILNEKNVGPHLDSMLVISPSIASTLVEHYTVEESEYYTQGYDCATLLTSAIETTTPTRRHILNRLESIDEFHGSGKYISFSDTSNHVNTALQVLRYQDASFHSLGYFKGDSLYSGEEPVILPDALLPGNR